MKVNSPRFRRASSVIFVLALGIHLLDFFWYDLFPIKSNFSAEQREQIQAEWEREDSVLALSTAIPEHISFNLNAVELEQLMSLGLDSFVSKRIIRFRNAIDGYRSVDQLYKIYGLDSAEVLRVQPHLFVREKTPSRQKVRSWNLSSFDPNTSGESEL